MDMTLLLSYSYLNCLGWSSVLANKKKKKKKPSYEAHLNRQIKFVGTVPFKRQGALFTE
jgi:hypothetical protein